MKNTYTAICICDTGKCFIKPKLVTLSMNKFYTVIYQPFLPVLPIL